MRVIGVGLPEHTLIAPWTLPLMIWLLRSASSLSLSTDDLNRYTVRSTVIATIAIEPMRMTHIPHPPSLNDSEIALRNPMGPLPPGARLRAGFTCGLGRPPKQAVRHPPKRR